MHGEQHRGGVSVLPSAYRDELEPGSVAIEENGALHLNWIDSASDTLERCRRVLRFGSYDNLLP